MKKLLLIQSYGIHRQGLFVTQSKYPPSGLGIVAKLTPSDWEIEIIDSLSSSQFNHKADLVAISSFTPTINNAYQIAAHYRERNIPVIIGGIHASILPDEVSQYCDSVVMGEAECVWPIVIRDFENGKLKQRYDAQRCDPKEICSPEYRLFNKGYKLNTIQASRGCPLNCEYCSITLLTGAKFRKRPVDHIMDDWRNIEQGFVWFSDDNLFGFNDKDRQWAQNLFSRIEAENFNKNWMCFAGVRSLLDEKTVAMAARSGCKIIYVGFETTDADSLISVKKSTEQLKYYKRVIDLLHKYGISVLAGIMLGFDNDTPESIDKRIDFVLESVIDSYFLTVMTPMPGTKLFDQYSRAGKLRYTNFPEDWGHYDWTELVFTPSRMSVALAEEAIFHAYQKAYAFQTIKNKFRQTREGLHSSETAMLNYLSNMDFRETFLNRI
ncbi:MAG: B12-binding domain-containing radical SAM protein [Bacteroidetes bacterium HGW-Bacteroidetes-21]|jgi:radical SAM superfamily enzyme YgiQ (UPF0313 family)|nr:MAG: B12-binding domain-containing radical SAM protein [Bacteroidetes bacterium HGW-Bacteroidetes-21]